MTVRTSDLSPEGSAAPVSGAAVSPQIVTSLVPVTVAGRPDLTTLAASLDSFAADLDTPDLVILLENRLL